MFVNASFHDPFIDVQQPLVIVNTSADTFTLTGAYYTFAHFGRFVEPGARRMEHERSVSLPSNVYVVAFNEIVIKDIRPFIGGEDQSKVVVEFANNRKESTSVTIVYDTYMTTVVLPPISLVTVVFSDDTPTNWPRG